MAETVNVTVVGSQACMAECGGELPDERRERNWSRFARERVEWTSGEALAKDVFRTNRAEIQRRHPLGQRHAGLPLVASE